MSPTPATRQRAIDALKALEVAAKSAAFSLSRCDYSQVVDWCDENLEFLADLDASIPPCQDCSGNNKATPDTREDSHPRCPSCQRQHEDNSAMAWDEAHPPRPSGL